MSAHEEQAVVRQRHLRKKGRTYQTSNCNTFCLATESKYSRRRDIKRTKKKVGISSTYFLFSCVCVCVNYRVDKRVLNEQANTQMAVVYFFVSHIDVLPVCSVTCLAFQSAKEKKLSPVNWCVGKISRPLIEIN